MNFVAAKRVVFRGLRSGIFDPATVAWISEVVEDDFRIKVHGYLKSFMVFSMACSAFSMSSSVL